MLIKTEAIVLHTTRYSDSRVIADMLTRSHGRLQFIVSLPKSARSKMKRSYLMPLQVISIEADLKQRAQLHTIRDASLALSLPALTTNPVKLSLTMFTAEFLYQATRSEQQNDGLYDYVRSAVEWLDRASGPVANFHIVLMTRLTRFLGFYPNTEDYMPHCYFDLRQATFVGVMPLHSQYIGPDEAAVISLFLRVDFATMHLLRLSRAQRNRVVDVLTDYYRLHLPQFQTPRSIEVLREIFE